MPEIQLIRVWNEPQCPVLIEYQPEVVEQICRRAIEGLLALPRVGLGVGGILFGSREREVVTIAECAPIACAHSLGPGFRLSPEETEFALSELSGRPVVGCYCAKPGGMAALSESDLAFFNTFCREPWQVMLQVKPSTVVESRLVLYFRDKAAAVVRGRERPLSEVLEPEPDLPEPEAPDFEGAEIEPPRAEVERVIPDAPAFAQQSAGGGRTVALLAAAALLTAAAVALLFRLQ